MAESDGGSGAGTGGSGSGGGFDWADAQGGAGLIGGLTAFYQPFISQNWASNAGNQAFDLQRWWAVNQASLQVKGLRKAGINPMIAFAKGGPGGGPSSTDVPYGQFDVDSDAIGRAVGSVNAARMAKEQIDLLRKDQLVRDEAVKQSQKLTDTMYYDNLSAMYDSNVKEHGPAIAEQQKLQAQKQTEALGVELEKARSALPAAKAMNNWLATPAGLKVQQAERLLGVAREGIGAITGAKQIIQRSPGPEVETTEGYDAFGRPTGASVRTRKRQ